MRKPRSSARRQIAIDAAIAAAAAAGSAAWVTARPMTSRSAPVAIAASRRGGAGLVVRVGAGRADAGHDRDEAGPELLGLADVGRGAHDAAAAGLERRLHALGEDVRRRVAVAGEDGDGERRSAASSPASAAPVRNPSTPARSIATPPWAWKVR